MNVVNYITSNKNKYYEARLIAKRFRYVLKHVNLKINEIQSGSQSYISYSIAKEAFLKLRQPVLVDDSGLYVSGMPQFPGSFTKYMLKFMGEEYFSKLFDAPTTATWKCYATYYDYYNVIRKAGSLKGLIKISENLKKYSYDDIFFVDDSRNLSSLSIIEKSRISHRSSALDKIFKTLIKK